MSPADASGSWDGDWMPPRAPDALTPPPRLVPPVFHPNARPVSLDAEMDLLLTIQERIVTPSGKELPARWLGKRVRVNLRSRP